MTIRANILALSPGMATESVQAGCSFESAARRIDRAILTMYAGNEDPMEVWKLWRSLRDRQTCHTAKCVYLRANANLFEYCCDRILKLRESIEAGEPIALESRRVRYDPDWTAILRMLRWKPPH